MAESRADVSVIIPCYQCKKTIVRALDSVLAQSTLPREVILIDDASGDDTIEFLIEVTKSYSIQIKLIQLNDNVGVGMARNIGLDEASASYVAFLDADDSWHPEKIAFQYGWMIENPQVTMSGHMIAENTFPKIESYRFKAKRLSVNKLLISNSLSTPTVMLKNKPGFRFPNERYAEDYGFWLRLAAQSECYKLNRCLALMYKAPYGAVGLSADLLKMEKGVQSVLKNLYKDEVIGFVIFRLSSVLSWLKYARRVLLTKLNL